MVLAINKAHQSRVNKAVKVLIKYNDLNNLRAIADNNGDVREYKKLEKQCENVFNKYLDVVYELPKREMERIEKSELY